MIFFLLDDVLNESERRPTKLLLDYILSKNSALFLTNVM